MQIEEWIDNNAVKFDGYRENNLPNHPFGYGSFVVPIEFDAANFGLEDNAEAQAIVDGSGFLRAVQVVDSRANIIVVNRYSNEWYRWRLDSISRINDRSGVVCSGRD